MYVVATAGHVDHGKSTLVRALTGMEPDRWEEERRRGLTIDLGFAWTTLPSDRRSHSSTYLATNASWATSCRHRSGAGVCFVVAADEGWQAQSSDHRDAVAALGIEHGLVVVTRADRAPGSGRGRSCAGARGAGRDTGLRSARCPVSAVDGTGLTDCVSTRRRPGPRAAPATTGRVRLWVDRSFTITGSGTVVTGTLAAGTLAGVTGSSCSATTVPGRGGPRPAELGHRLASVEPVSRVALNLRDVAATDIRRGDALVTPDAWPTTGVVGIHRTTGRGHTEVPEQLMVHVGTASVPARLRPFGEDTPVSSSTGDCRWFSATGWCCATPGAAQCWAARGSSTPTRRPCGGAATAPAGRSGLPAWTPPATCWEKSPPAEQSGQTILTGWGCCPARDRAPPPEV